MTTRDKVERLLDRLSDEEPEAHGYTPGTSVLVDELDDGELRIMSTEQLRKRIRSIGERVVSEHAEALKILAEDDPDAGRASR